jgi:hypothetical protein
MKAVPVSGVVVDRKKLTRLHQIDTEVNLREFSVFHLCLSGLDCGQEQQGK